MEIFLKILFLLLAYLLGSIPFGFIFGKMNGIDIRQVGSKNIGATNTGRALGLKYAILTYFCDMLKGAIIVFLFRFEIIPSTYCVLNPMLYGLLAVIGHTFPIYLKFKGGKSVACGSGVLGAYCPILLPIAIVIFFVVFLITKYVSLGSLIGALCMFIGTIIVTAIAGQFSFDNVNPQGNLWAYNLYFIIFSFVIMAIIYIKHSSNIKRLINGNENKINIKKKEKAEN